MKKSNFGYQPHYPKRIIKQHFHKNAGRNIVCEWAARLPGNTGCNYTLWGSGRLLKASFFYHRQIKVRAATPPPQQSGWKDSARSHR